MSGYRVMPAEAAHVAAIPAVERAAAALFPTADLPGELRDRVTDAGVLSAAQRGGRLWVALDAARAVVGFALADRMDGDAFLDEVDVMPAHGRHGLGRRLVATVAEWASAERHSALLLVTFRHLPWNAPFYASLGFEELGDDELGVGVRERLRIEAAAGIDVGKRVAMRLELRR